MYSIGLLAKFTPQEKQPTRAIAYLTDGTERKVACLSKEDFINALNLTGVRVYCCFVHSYGAVESHCLANKRKVVTYFYD
jgi:hypothetical protein